MRKRLLAVYRRLYRHFGPQQWWPGDGPFEVIVGAILAQNTSWANVEKAITNLKEAGVLSPGEMAALDSQELAGLIRPSGYYRVKANRLHHFLAFFKERYEFSLEAMFNQPLSEVRESLLGVKGIGPETADSILLYAGGYPIFVVDAYTRRIFSRHGFIRPGGTYEELQALFMDTLPRDARLYNEYHALIVRAGKTSCLSRPRCKGCVLRSLGDQTPHFAE